MTWFDLAMAVRPFFLVLMMAIFAGIAWRVLTPGRRQEQQERALIPLLDDSSDRAAGGRQ